jgi:hypothetical protein
MRRQLILFLFFALLIPLLSYSEPSATTAKTFSSPKADAKADEAWRSFYASFRAAVKKRDRAALKRMMLPDFTYTFGGSDSRDDAFSYWDQPSVKGWTALDRILARGSVKDEDYPLGASGAKRPSRIAPPQARRDGYTGWRSIWVYGEDGRWYWAAFVQGD